jgi:hypothetical protein
MDLVAEFADRGLFLVEHRDRRTRPDPVVTDHSIGDPPDQHAQSGWLADPRHPIEQPKLLRRSDLYRDRIPSAAGPGQ